MTKRGTEAINLRIPGELRDTVDVAMAQAKAEGTPVTLTQVIIEALHLWLDARGTPLPPAAVEAVQNARPVGRPKKPPFALPEGTDAQALWNEFWTMAYTQGWSKAVSWATQKYHTTIGGFDHAVRAALPADVRPTREDLGLVSEREWIEAQVAAVMQPKPGKAQP